MDEKKKKTKTRKKKTKQNQKNDDEVDCLVWMMLASCTMV